MSDGWSIKVRVRAANLFREIAPRLSSRSFSSTFLLDRASSYFKSDELQLNSGELKVAAFFGRNLVGSDRLIWSMWCSVCTWNPGYRPTRVSSSLLVNPATSCAACAEECPERRRVTLLPHAHSLRLTTSYHAPSMKVLIERIVALWTPSQRRSTTHAINVEGSKPGNKGASVIFFLDEEDLRQKWLTCY